MTEEPILPPTEPEKVAELPTEINEVIIRSYPKTVLFYPMVIISIIVAIILEINILFFAIPNPLLYQQILNTVTFLWLLIFFFNLLLVTFDFGKTVVLGLIFLVVVIVLGITVVFLLYGFVPWINPAVLGLQINLNAVLAFFLIFVVSIFIAWLRAQVYYFKVTPNEIIYKKGVIGDVERYGTSNVVFHKEIIDIFEYLILRSGRLTFSVPGRKTAIVLDTVPRINSIEQKLLYLLRRIEVDID